MSAIGAQLDIGLLSMANLADENDGVWFLRCAIDFLSRKLWVRSLKSKTAKKVLRDMKDILKDISPTKEQKICADREANFESSALRSSWKPAIYTFLLLIII